MRAFAHVKPERSTTSECRPFVLHVRVVSETGGGPEKTILNSPRFLRQLGYESKCAYMHPPGDGSFDRIAARALAAAAPVVSIPDRGPLDWRVVARLIRLCRAANVRIWHGHDYKSNVLGLFVKRFHPMQLVTTVHGWGRHGRRTRLYYRIDRWSLRYYDAVVCVSQDLYEQCLGLGIPQGRCHLIHNAIDAEEYRRSAGIVQTRHALGEPPSALLIGAAGRLSAEKGFDDLIRAVAELAGRGVEVSLWIAGEGDARPQLDRLIDDLGCRHRIRLLGHVADLKPFYQALDLFVLSSLREGLPNVVLEAMALEVPVVATRVAGVPALIRDGENGVLVDIGSANQLAEAIERLSRDPGGRRRMAEAARRTVEASCSFAARMQKMVAVYKQLEVGDRRSEIGGRNDSQ